MVERNPASTGNKDKVIEEAELGKKDFDIWCKQQLKNMRELVGDYQKDIDVTQLRVKSLYDEIINTRREIMRLQESIKFKLGVLARYKAEIAAIEKAHRKVFPPTEHQSEIMNRLDD